MKIFHTDDLEATRREAGDRYHEFLRVPALSAGLYGLPAGGVDPQRPHGEDEVYVVVRGKARIRVGDEDEPVTAGSIVYVAPGVEHRFHAIEEDLEVLVLFAPAESTPSAGGTDGSGKGGGAVDRDEVEKLAESDG